MHRPDDIAELVRTARSGTRSWLISRSAEAGGAADRSHPGALDWLRRWRPRHPVSGADIPACGCAAGRCVVCN
jgi:hypothetical protein